MSRDLFKIEVCTKIKQKMRNLDMSVKQLADKSGIPPKQLHGYVVCKFIPTFYILCKIAKALDVDVNYFDVSDKV
jgi:transcriptional regulator with XRE-family HTH domain